MFRPEASRDTFSANDKRSCRPFPSPRTHRSLAILEISESAFCERRPLTVDFAELFVLNAAIESMASAAKKIAKRRRNSRESWPRM